MYQLKKISTAVAMIGFSTAVFMGQSVAAPLDSVNANNQATTNNSDNQTPTNNDEASISKKIMLIRRMQCY